MNTTKLTNGFLVLRPGEHIQACLSPKGYAWTLENQTKRPFRLRIGTQIALGNDEWVVEARNGLAQLSWLQLIPEET